VDPHTADGLFVAEPWREAGVKMICLETALPVKFAETIREALGQSRSVPLPSRASTARPALHADADGRGSNSSYIAAHCPAVA
jgi:threonine synthase